MNYFSLYMRRIRTGGLAFAVIVLAILMSQSHVAIAASWSGDLARAKALLESGQAAAAIDLYEELEAAYPDQVDILSASGLAHFKFRGAKEGISRLRRVTELTPEDFGAWDVLLFGLLHQGDQDAYGQARENLLALWNRPTRATAPSSAMFIRDIFSTEKQGVQAFEYYPVESHNPVRGFFWFQVRSTNAQEDQGYLLLASNREETEYLIQAGALKPGFQSYYMRHYLPSKNGYQDSYLIQLLHLDEPPSYDLARQIANDYLHGKIDRKSGFSER